MNYDLTIILIPGFTMNSSSMNYYKTKLNTILPHLNIKYIVPKPIKRKISIYNNKVYYSWYDYLTPDNDKEPLINETHLLSSRVKIQKIIDKEIKYYNNDHSKIYLLGVSQGCCVAIDAGITYPYKLGGIIGFKGHVITRSLYDFSHKQKIWVCHGKSDKTIYYKFAKKSYMNLSKINPDIYLLSQENVNHSNPSGIILQMKSLHKWFHK